MTQGNDGDRSCAQTKLCGAEFSLDVSGLVMVFKQVKKSTYPTRSYKQKL